MSKIKWIQLSDLHFGDDSPYSKKSIEVFLKYTEMHGKDINGSAYGLWIGDSY